METNLDWTKVEHVDGWLTRSESKLLCHLASKVSDGGVIVEIGSWKGKSTICLANGAMPNTKIYAIDPHVGSAEHQADTAAQIWTFDQFKQNLNMAGVSDSVVPIVDYSQNVAKTWNQPIDLLFIDGAHDEKSVRTDFELFWNHVRVGGWVAMHDTTGTWQPGLCGWKGPRKVANKYLFRSGAIGDMCVADTITAGQRVSSVSFSCRWRKTMLRIRKIPSDILSIAINAVIHLPPPLVQLAKKILRRG